MGCFHVSPSSQAAIPVAQQPAAVVASLRPVVRRGAHTLCSPSPPRQQMQMLRPAQTPYPRLAFRAQNHLGDSDGDGDGDRPLPPNASSLLKLTMWKRVHNFPKEECHISSHQTKLTRVANGLLHDEARINTRCRLCGLAENAVAMASLVVDSASLNPTTTPCDISRDTVHRTLGAYVQIFVQTADDTFNNTVSKETVTSFLGALRGLASVAHILLQAALEGLCQKHPKESLSEYAFNCDVKNMYRVYDRRMHELEEGIRNAPTEMHTYKIVLPTICKGMEATESFVTLMMTRRKRTLEKTHSKSTSSRV